MWIILEFVLLAGIVLVSITEFFYPLLAGKPLFGSFRRKTVSPPDASLESKLADARDKVNAVKNVQAEINKNYQSAEELKNKSDDLLNNA